MLSNIVVRRRSQGEPRETEKSDKYLNHASNFMLSNIVVRRRSQGEPREPYPPKMFNIYSHFVSGADPASKVMGGDFSNIW